MRHEIKNYTASVLESDALWSKEKNRYVGIVLVDIADQEVWVECPALNDFPAIKEIVNVKEEYFDDCLYKRTATYDVLMNRELEEEPIDPSADYDANIEMPE